MPTLNPQTGLELKMPTPTRVDPVNFDTRMGEVDFQVHRIGPDLWETATDVPGVRAGSILIRDMSRDVSCRSPFVTIVEGGLHNAIRQQADHLPATLGRELEGLLLSIDMVIEACMTARALHLMNFENIATWRAFVGAISDDLGRDVREELKVEAKTFLDFASDPFDSLDRLNGPSRMLVLQAAIRRLSHRVDMLHYLIGVTYNRRALDLFALYDRVWQVRTLVLQELTSMCVQYERPRSVTTEWADRAADRLDICVALLETVLVAPYGTNSFRHTAAGLREASVALREERFGDAGLIIDTDRRSLSMLSLQRELEAKLRIISGYRHEKHVPTDKEQGAFARTLATRRDFLLQNPEIDLGFSNRIAQDLAGYLDATVDAAVGSHWDIQGVYESLASACACFGRSRAA